MQQYLTKGFWTLILMFGLIQVKGQCPNVVWGDEFTGTALNQNMWNIQTGDGCAEGICGWGNSELQSYQPENVSVANGNLTITAKKQRIRGTQYTSGRINSKGKGDFTYGRFESRIKLPLGDGLWPAFWMLSTDEVYGGWPQSGEIDIMEFTASRPDNVYGTIHYGDLYPDNKFQGNEYFLKNGELFPDDYHEFAIEWEPNEIRWYVDGVLFSTKTPDDIAPYNWPFNQDFHFLLNVAVGGNLGGPVDDAIFPVNMDVDYVRVYDGFKPGLDGSFVVSNQAVGESYTITNLPSNVNVTWSVPAGATVASGQGSNQATINFGTTSGPVSATFNDGCTTKTLTMEVEVEPPYVQTLSFVNFDGTENATLASATGTLTQVANPAPNAINGSSQSAEYIRNAAERYDLVVYNTSAITDADAYVSKDKRFYMDVLTAAPVGTAVFIQLENSTATAANFPDGRHSRYIAFVEETNAWHQLEFKLLDRPDPSAPTGTVSTMILLFNSDSFTSDTYYFDNLDSYDADFGTPTSNQAPTVSITSPSGGSTFNQGSAVTVAANAADSDGTIAQVEFFANGTSIGVDTNSPFSVNWTVASGSTDLTATATDNEGAQTTSAAVNVTGQSTGTATDIYVSDILLGSASAGKGNKNATATVTVLNNLGNPASGATVVGQFAGTFSETVAAVTNASGVAVLTTTGSNKGSLTINFCVNDVTGSLPYDPALNTISCLNGTARLVEADLSALDIQIYPNPVMNELNLSGIEGQAIVQIIDLSGKMIKTFQYDHTAIDVTDLEQGLYLVKVVQENKSQTIRFVK